MNSFDWFEALCRKRQNLLDAHSENDIGRGVWQSAVEKYPDPTHFVYELLQNAEDQGATVAEFELLPMGLRFRHNGAPFSAEDVESITGWGNSQKPDLENKIGRFGIGFKSVFMITDKPRVFTFIAGAPFAFSIEELFLPVAQPEGEAQCEPGWTKFWLPFWIQRAATLHGEIERKLRGLGAGTLLFLRHLKEIHWKVGEYGGAFLCERKGGRIDLIESRSQGASDTLSPALMYRVFERPVRASAVDREVTVKVAFRLDDEGRCAVPEAQNTLVHVYFPTEQPFPAKFLIHAPFLLTDNRANLKQGHPFNAQLVGELADLVVFALPKLRDEKLLGVRTLAALPLDEKAFEGTDFRPIFSSIAQSFKDQNLLPSADGAFVVASQARLARSAELRELISPSQLGALYDSPQPIHWLHEEITEDRTPEVYRFINAALGVARLDGESLGLRLNGDFLFCQTDAWMLDFYRFLGKQEALWRPSANAKDRGPLRYKPIIRTADQKQAAPFSDDEVARVFLRAGAGGDAPQRVVAPQFLENAEARSFFERLGLREPDVVDEVRHQVLPRYSEGEMPKSDALYRRDLNLIATAVWSASADAAFLEAVCGAFFVRAVNAVSGEKKLFDPQSVYTRTADLEAWFEGNEAVWFLDEEIESSADWQRIQKALRAAKFEIAPETLKIKFEAPGSDGYTALWDSHGNHERGLKGFDPYAKIPGLEEVLKHPTPQKSHILWNLLRNHPHLIYGEIEASTHRDYRGSEVSDCWSKFGDLCQSNAWLPHPTQSGQWCKPADIELGELPDGWDKHSEAARAVAFQLGMKRSELQETAEKLGFSAADLDFLQQNKGFIADFRRLVEDKRQAEFPERSVPDAARRAQRVAATAQEAPIKKHEVKARSVRVSELARDEKRQYLRAAYTNHDSQLVCQMCQNEMPFKLHNGDHFFEAVACLPALEREAKENYLALCPVCAAKYQYALDHEAEDLADLVSQAGAHDQQIEVSVVGQAQAIRFVQSHWLDLQTILQTHHEA